MSPGRAGIGLLACALVVGALISALPARPAAASSPAIGWTTQVPGDRVSIAFIEELDGYLYVGGHADGAVEGEQGNGLLDAYVAKLDLAGNLVWAHQFGTQQIDLMWGFDVNRTGILVGGSTYGAFPGFSNLGLGHTTDGYVAAFDLDGARRWLSQFGGLRSDEVQAVALGPAGEQYVVGSEASARTGFIARYKAAGGRLWSQTINAYDENGQLTSAWPVAVDADGFGPVVVGRARGSVVYGVVRLWQDTWVRRLQADGTVVWTRQHSPDGVGDPNVPYLVAINRSGIAVSGVYGDNSHPYLRRYSVTGILEWERARQVTAFHADCDDFSVAGNDEGRYAEPATGFGGRAGAYDLAGNVAWNLTQPAGDSDEWQYLDIDTSAGVAYVVRQHDEFLDPTVTTYDVARIDGVPAPACPHPNLIANGGFEDAAANGTPDVWKASPVLNRSSAVAHRGSFAGRWRSSVNADASTFQQVRVTGGTSYAVSAWLNAPQTSDGFSFTIRLRWRSATAGLGTVAVRTFTDDTGGAWVNVRKTVHAPALATRVRVELVAASLRGPIFVDDITLRAP